MIEATAGLVDLVPVTSRLGVLQWVRLALAGMVIALVLAVPSAVLAEGRLLLLTGGYLVLTALGGFTQQASGTRAHLLVSTLLLVDGAWIALALDATGGPVGVLGFLVPLHVVAASLLLSHRSGLKVALWHALLLGVADAAGSGDRRTLAYAATAYLLTAAIVAWCSSLNERALRRNTGQLAGLVALGDELERSSGIDDVCTALCLHVTERLGFSRAAVVAERDLGAWCGAVVERGGVPVLATGDPMIDLSDALWIGPRHLELVAELDRANVPELTALLPDAMNVVVVPLIAEGRRVATLAAEWGPRAGTVIPSSTVTALTSSANHTGLALRNAFLLAEVEQYATSDGLTGLANRRVLDESLERAVALSERTGAPLSLVVFDLDRFKDVNDRYGHQVGDAVLRAVGRALADTSRTADLAARYGGEELALLCPDTTSEEALALAERVRAAVAAAPTPVPVTISAGVASVPGDGVDGVEELVGAADAALYESKRRGRDRATRAGSWARTRPLRAG